MGPEVSSEEEPLPSGVSSALHGGQDGTRPRWNLLFRVGLLQIHFSSTAQQFSPDPEHQGLRARPPAAVGPVSLHSAALCLAQRLRPLLREASRTTWLFPVLPFIGPPCPLWTVITAFLVNTCRERTVLCWKTR